MHSERGDGAGRARFPAGGEGLSVCRGLTLRLFGGSKLWFAGIKLWFGGTKLWFGGTKRLFAGSKRKQKQHGASSAALKRLGGCVFVF